MLRCTGQARAERMLREAGKEGAVEKAAMERELRETQAKLGKELSTAKKERRMYAAWNSF